MSRHAIPSPIATLLERADQLALVFAKHEGEIDNARLRRMTGQHPADVTKALAALRDRGPLQMIGGGRGARYELGPSATGDLGALFSAVARVTGSSEDSGPSSEVSEPSLEALAAELAEISHVAQTRLRLDPRVRDQILIQLCARVPLSLAELARLMEREEAYLRQRFRSLIASGRLTYLYPAQPSHPRQKYVAVLVADEREGDQVRRDPR